MASIRPLLTSQPDPRGKRSAREWLVITGSVGMLAALAWTYMVYLYVSLPDMAQMAAPNLQPWTLTDFVMMFIM